MKKPQFSLTGEMVQSLSHLHISSLDSAQYVHGFFALVSPELDTVLQLQPRQCWIRWGITSIELVIVDCLMQPMRMFAFATRSHHWLMFNWWPPQPSRPFSDKLLSSWSAPSMWRCSFPRAGLRVSFCWETFVSFLSAYFSSLSRSLCMAAQLPTTIPHIHCGTNRQFLHLWYKSC